MSKFSEPRDGSIWQPLLVAVLIAAIATTVLGQLSLSEYAGEESELALFRLIQNPFGLGIIGVGLSSVFYALIQIWAVALDQNQVFTGSLKSWISGRDGISLTSVIEPIAVADRASVLSDIWETLRSRRALPISYAIWVLPLLGFIGTVIGISGAIGNLGDVFADNDRTEALQEVLTALRFAFDTTFLGLAFVIPTMALSTILRARSDAVRQMLVLAHMKLEA